MNTFKVLFIIYSGTDKIIFRYFMKWIFYSMKLILIDLNKNLIKPYESYLYSIKKKILSKPNFIH